MFVSRAPGLWVGQVVGRRGRMLWGYGGVLAFLAGLLSGRAVALASALGHEVFAGEISEPITLAGPNQADDSARLRGDRAIAARQQTAGTLKASLTNTESGNRHERRGRKAAGSVRR